MGEKVKGYEISINVDTLTKRLDEELKSTTDLFMPSDCCIFRVPTILSRHNPEAYSPNAFSIGPFHYNKPPKKATQDEPPMKATQDEPPMKATQKIKLKYLNGLISRSNKSLRFFIDAISESKQEARESYAGPIDGIDNEEFIKVLVLDGCFIVELFRKDANEDLRDQDDPIFAMPCLRQSLYHDLILLENQVPWFVLEILFNKTKTNAEKTLTELAIKFFSNIFSVIPLSSIAQGNHGGKHILDLLRNCLKPSHIANQGGDTEWERMPSVTSLKEAGIKFKRRSEPNSILNITFDKGVLEISPLHIQETTEPLFRNLISFEQCCPKVLPVITSYAILMDNLINTRKDMEILEKNEVIDNWLNVEDATRFFNKLYNDTYIQEHFYVPLSQEVNRHCQRRWPRYRAVLMRDYFKHPWALISFFVAAFLVICTFLQTLFSIIK